jgi:hypothetical protein
MPRRGRNLSVNSDKSVLHPVTCLTYLGLRIDTVLRIICPTQQWIQHLEQLLAIVPLTSRQDLFRIAGYPAWLCWTMGWPQFLLAHVRQSSTYWVRVLRDSGFLRKPRFLRVPHTSVSMHTDATPSSLAAMALTQPRMALVRRYADAKPIAFAEMTSALVGLLWLQRSILERPTTIALCTDSSVVFHTLCKGTGAV